MYISLLYFMRPTKIISSTLCIGAHIHPLTYTPTPIHTCSSHNVVNFTFVYCCCCRHRLPLVSLTFECRRFYFSRRSIRQKFSLFVWLCHWQQRFLRHTRCLLCYSFMRSCSPGRHCRPSNTIRFFRMRTTMTNKTNQCATREHWVKATHSFSFRFKYTFFLFHFFVIVVVFFFVLALVSFFIRRTCNQSAPRVNTKIIESNKSRKQKNKRQEEN